MSDQIVGTVSVYQVNSPVSPRVRSINSGLTTIKGASDVDISGAQEGEVLVYRAATNSFEVAPVTATGVGGLDAGTF